MDYETFKARSPLKSFLTLVATLVAIIGGVLGIVALGDVLTRWTGYGDEAPVAERQVEKVEAPVVADEGPTDEQMLQVGQWLVRQQLRDPDAAQFRRMVVRGAIICGEVNSKNGFGGYSGFQRFITAGTEATVFEQSMAAGEMDKAWQEYCGVG